MSYEEAKARNNKPKGNQAPLIPHKKHSEFRDKENEKNNYELYAKNRTHYHHHDLPLPEPTETKLVLNYATQPHYTQQAHQGKQRYPHPSNNNHHHVYPQPHKPLTFANVKQVSRPKQNGQICSFVTNHDNKKALLTKNPILVEKQRLVTNPVERTTTALLERTERTQGDKKENNMAKIAFALRPVVDDFACTEQLQYRPVEKKSLIPEKKVTSEKTTSKFDFKPCKKEPRRNDHLKQLKQFEAAEKSINALTDSDSFNQLCQLQQEYSVDPNYLEKCHKGLIWWSRAILVDWMRHICYQFGLQRDTYHIAVVLLDNYLARTNNVPKSVLQAIGATCLFIASKLEEFQCRESKQFAKSTNNSCSVADIHDLEIKIVKVLRFRLNPPTLFSLTNRMMSQWDIFVEEGSGKTHQLWKNRTKAHFKQLDQNSYRLFRELMQLVDCSILDIQTAQYRPKMLIASFMYLLLGCELLVFEREEVVTDFPGSSLYLLDETNEFNNIFGIFVMQVFGCTLFEILPSVQYCATYFGLSYSYQKPMISHEQDLESMSLEEYCSYQTYNSAMIKNAKNRYRGIY